MRPPFVSLRLGVISTHSHQFRLRCPHSHSSSSSSSPIQGTWPLSAFHQGRAKLLHQQLHQQPHQLHPSAVSSDNRSDNRSDNSSQKPPSTMRRLATSFPWALTPICTISQSAWPATRATSALLLTTFFPATDGVRTRVSSVCVFVCSSYKLCAFCLSSLCSCLALCLVSPLEQQPLPPSFCGLSE